MRNGTNLSENVIYKSRNAKFETNLDLSDGLTISAAEYREIRDRLKLVKSKFYTIKKK